MDEKHWWQRADMTGPEQVSAAADAAGVLRETFTGSYELGDGEQVDVPMILVDAHQGPWVIYPSPDTILGWAAAQADVTAGGAVDLIAGTDGWLGAGDLEPERVVANLLEADDLPTDLHGRSSRVSTRRRG